MCGLQRLARAFELAYRAHYGRSRKGTNIPYITHPIDVASILMKNYASEDLVIAGLLHDVVEDTDVELVEIEKQFGKTVSELVRKATEPEKLNRDAPVEKKETWKKRKLNTIQRTRSGNRDLKLLECADKLANIRDIVRDYNRIGEELWKLFNASSKDQRWYYESMVRALGSQPHSLEGTEAYEELMGLVTEFFHSSGQARELRLKPKAM